MGSQTVYPELVPEPSTQYPLDDRQSKKVCRRGLAIYTGKVPRRLTLPKLPSRPPSPTAKAVSTWDEVIPNENHIMQDVPISQQSLKDQDAYFSEPAYPAQEVLYAAANAVRGEGSQFVLWDYETMRLQARPVRMVSISSAATTGMLQECANVGSYVRRLRYVVTRIESSQANQILLALASAIEDEVDRIIQIELDTRHTLGLLMSIQEPANMAYLLARVVGCADLSVAAELRSLPSTPHLLNTAYNEMLRIQLEPVKYAVLWKIVGRTIEPWLAQLNRMLGSDPSIFSIPAEVMVADFLPDMFIVRQGPFFALDPSRRLKFMSSRIAQLAVECLNCGLILKYLTPRLELPIAWFSCLHASSSLGLNYGMSSDPFNPGHLDSKYTAPPRTISNGTPKDPELAMFALVQPIGQRHAVLNAAAMEMLSHKLEPVTLKGHADILVNIFCLKNGKLFASLQNNIETLNKESDAAKWELAADAVKESLIRTIEQFELPPHCVIFNFKRPNDKSLNSPVSPVYVVPAPADMILTPEIVHHSTIIFHILIELQTSVQNAIKTNNRVETQKLFRDLFDISLVVSTFSNDLAAALNNPDQTLAGLINAFSQISNVATNIRQIIGK